MSQCSHSANTQLRQHNLMRHITSHHAGDKVVSYLRVSEQFKIQLSTYQHTRLLKLFHIFELVNNLENNSPHVNTQSYTFRAARASRDGEPTDLAICPKFGGEQCPMIWTMSKVRGITYDHFDGRRRRHTFLVEGAAGLCSTSDMTCFTKERRKTYNLLSVCG